MSMSSAPNSPAPLSTATIAVPYITTPQDQTLSRAAAVGALISSLNDLIASATLDLQDATMGRDQQATARAIINEAQAAIALWQADAIPQVSPTLVVIQPQDTTPLLAMQRYGDPLRYRDILALNGRRGFGVAAGEQLRMPAS